MSLTLEQVMKAGQFAWNDDEDFHFSDDGYFIHDYRDADGEESHEIATEPPPNGWYHTYADEPCPCPFYPRCVDPSEP